MTSVARRIRLFTFILSLLSIGGASANGSLVLPLSALTPSSSQQSWGSLAYDRSVQGNPIRIAGRTFARGLGTHARSEIVYDLEGPCERFEAWVGVDDEMDYRKEASVIFRVLADGREIAASPVMHAQEKAVRLAAPLKGVSELRLVVEDAGDGIDSDHADWGDARIISISPKAIRIQNKPSYYIHASGISIALSDSGEIVGIRLSAPGAKPVFVAATGDFRIIGANCDAFAAPKRLPDGGIEFHQWFSRNVRQTCGILQKFSPRRGSIRWTVEITGYSSPWSAPLITRFSWPATRASRFWTAWGDPDGSPDRWHDPLETRPFANRSLSFGGAGNAANTFSIPLATVLEMKSGVALSVAPSLEDTFLDMSLSTRSDGEFSFIRRNHRIDNRKTLRFSVDLVPHAPDVRAGLGWLTNRYPQFFHSPNPNAADVAGCGAYSTYEGPLDVAKMRRMGFRVNWKASFDFPYMGMFLPPTKSMDERWPRFDADSGGSVVAEKKTYESRRSMSDYSRRMRDQGFRVLNYFNVTEFGASIGAPGSVRSDLPASDQWQDATTFLYRRIADGILTDEKGERFGSWGGAVAMDPGGPNYRKFLLDQARRHVAWLPASSGICIDRTDWLSRYDPRGNDGESWIADHSARALALSWRRLMTDLAPIFHNAGKSIFVNPLNNRIDLWRQVDGFYAEFGGNPPDFNAAALAGMFKPVIEWTPTVDTLKPDPDLFFQRHLYMGVFPTAPFPGNDHTIGPDAWAERYYLDYGPMLTALRGRRWVLRPQPVAVESGGAKANLFETPDGYALPIVFGGKSERAQVVVRGVTAHRFNWTALHPGSETPAPIRAVQRGSDAILDVPLVRGCAMVVGKRNRGERAGMHRANAKNICQSIERKTSKRGEKMNSVSIVWKSGSPEGTVEVEYGRRVGMKIAEGEGTIEGDRFTIRSSGPCRLDLTFEDVNVGFGSHPTLATIRTRSNPFSFFLRDARSECPIFLPDYGVAVLPGDDSRTYEAVEKAIRAKGLQDSLQKIESEPEESYADAAAHTRSMHVPTWLGLSRDFRIFQVEYALESMEHEIQPQFHGFAVPLKETGDKPVWYRFYFSRGVSCERNISRRLEDGDLPILHGTLTDDDVSYQFATFASPERSALTEKALRGTDYLVADAHGYSNMMTPEQKARLDAVTPAEMNRDEETILWHRVVAVNRSRVPRYAWFKCPYPNGAYHFDGANGFGVFEDGKVFVVAKLDGQPMPKEEVAVMLDPGESATFDFALAHEPISLERAEALAKQKFEARHDECRAFWRGKLAKAAQISLPEKRIEEMLRAGLLHLDLVAYGLEPDQPVAATIGVYCPIGSESSPIIQAMDSFGWRSLAERSLDYFLVKQHDDGFIQNFGGYMLETGAALWSMGEHYRYSHDDEWAKRIAPKVLKSCEFLLNWRERNRREDLRRHGYGMIEGKVADPEDPFRAFMLNGYAYLGLSRASEMLASVDPEESARLKREAEAFKADIRTALFESMTNSPVVPLKDGTWVPSTPPWAEAQGPVSLMTDDQKWFTHGGFTVRDSLLGPIYLILQEVLNPSEPAASAIVRTHADLYHVRNVAPSQPYYSPHALAHLRRGEVKAFLKTYYNGFAGLADRETYDFWEHFFHASPHKTHEEGWFLMQTRWMLWMEDGETLNLLPGIPRAWLKSGQRIVLKNVSTYFGAASLEVESQLDQNRIVARIECDSSRKPERIRLRLPHPLGRKAKHVIGGTYDAKTETIVIAPFNGKAEAILEF